MVRAAVGVPLVKGGRLAAVLFLHFPAPHEWPADEVALVEEVAERTWAAVERARVEAALRTREARYRTLFETMDEGFVIAEVVYDAAGRPVDILYLEGNPAASRLTGVPDYSRRLWSEVVPEAEPDWVEIYDRVARTGVAERVERFLAPHQKCYDFFISRVADADGTHDAAPRVAVLFQDVTERRRAEAERERLAVAEAVAAERQALLKRIVGAQEEERRRVAHEVHDSVTQLAHAAAL